MTWKSWRQMTLNQFIKWAIMGLLVIYALMSVTFYSKDFSKHSTRISLYHAVHHVKKMFDNLEKSRITCSLVCPSRINGQEESYHKCMKKDDDNNHIEFQRLLTNCSRFLVNRGYILQSMTQEEEDFPLAFSLLVFCCPYQVEKLLRAIYRPQNYYCIHVDSKAKESFKKCMFSLANCLPNVFIAEKLELVRWGTFGVVKAELSCMKDLLHYKKWKYLINLTGQEFPLKTNLQLVRILKILNGANDISTKILPHKLFRIKFNYDDHGIATGKKEPPPFNLSIFSGSTHISATHAFVDFLINDPKAQIYLNWVKDTKIPDETVFSMINGNPQLGVPGAYKGSLMSINDVPFLSRYKIWSDDINPLCGGYYRRGVCIFSMSDLPRLVTAFQLVANKFTGDKSNAAKYCLDEWLFNRTRDEYLGRYTFDLSKYRNLPQVYP